MTTETHEDDDAPTIKDHGSLYMAVGEIRSDVKKLTKLNDRVGNLERNQTYALGFVGALAMLSSRSILDFVRGLFGGA